MFKLRKSFSCYHYQQDPFLSFSHTFSPKSVRVGGWCPPPNGSAPPQQEILDLPLVIYKEVGVDCTEAFD